MTVGGTQLARIITALVGLAPVGFLLWHPATSIASVILSALAITCAVHGLGRCVGWLAGDGDAPVGLAIAWGLAAYLGVGGAIAAVTSFGEIASGMVLVAGVVLHAGWLSQAIGDRVIQNTRVRPALWIAGAFAVAVVGFLALAAAARAGEVGTGLRPGGSSGDAVLPTLAAMLSPRAGLIVDRGVMFGLVVLLAVSRGPTRASRATLAALLPLALTAVPEYVVGAAPLWSIVALVFASVHGYERACERDDPRGFALAALTAGAAATLTAPVLAFAIAIAIGAAARSRSIATRRTRSRRTIATLAPIAALIAVGAGALIASPPLAAHLTPFAGAFAAAGALAALMIAIALRRRPAREATIAVAAAIAIIGTVTSRGAAIDVLVPLGVAIALLLVLDALVEPTSLDEVAPARTPFAAAVVVATAVVAGVALAPFATGRPVLAWQTRLAQLVADVRSLADPIPRE